MRVSKHAAPALIVFLNERMNVLAQRVAQETVCGECRIPGKDSRGLAALPRGAQGRDQRAPPCQAAHRQRLSRQGPRQQARMGAPEALVGGLPDFGRRLRRITAAAERRLRHLQAIRPGAVCRSLPRVRQGARAPLRQMQQRARVLRRQSRASADGRGVPAGVV